MAALMERNKEMFQRILVPLDGSERAERAIPFAASIARATHGSVVILRVDTGLADLAWQSLESALMLPEALEAQREEIKRYLAQIACSATLDGVGGVVTEVVAGVPAEAILSTASSLQADIIVMSSHGYTGFKRWMLGSVAQKVVHHSTIPVLILPEESEIPANRHPQTMRPVRMMVALDGSSLAEAALKPAAYLSHTLSAPFNGELHLVRVLHWPAIESGRHSDVIAAAKMQAFAEATDYLKIVQQRLQEGEYANLHLHITLSVIVNTDVAGMLLAIAETGKGMEKIKGFQGCDLLAMATHGRGGLAYWFMGSVTERVLGHAKLPLVIVRPPQVVPRNEETKTQDKSKKGVTLF